MKKSDWGRGYGTEGAKAIIAKAFTQMGRNSPQRIIATAVSNNYASIRVMEKAGLKFELNWLYYSRLKTYIPAVKYSLGRKEWLDSY